MKAPRPSLMPFRRQLFFLLCCGLGLLSSCKKKELPAAAEGEATAATGPATGSAVTDRGGAGGKIAKKPEPPKPQAINLRKLPIFDGGELQALSPANLNYKVKSEVKSVFDFHRKQLLALAWKETPETSVTNQYASGTFTGAGYKISVSVYDSGTPGELSVMLHNHGNADLAKLPLPPGTTPVYVGPLSAMHVTEAAVAETAEAVRKLLLDDGWEWHGSEGDTSHYKKGFNRVSAMISAAPAQGGKTMINYGCELMSGDLPAPPDAEDLHYNDPRQELTFWTRAEKDAVVDFFKERLAKSGFKNDDEKTYRVDDYDQMVFRSPEKNVIFLKVHLERGGRRNVALSYLSAEDIAEMDRKYKEQQALKEKGKK